MKEYTPLKMIRAGRYKVCFAALAPELQQEVLRRMETLITENAEWCDRGNYGHLCNILPTIAIDEALQAHGKTADEAFELISSHMWAALTPEMYIKLSRLPFFLSVMRKIIPLGFKYGSGKGWRYVWHPDDPKDRYHFETLESSTAISLRNTACLNASVPCSATATSSTSATCTISISSARRLFVRVVINAISALSATRRMKFWNGRKVSDYSIDVVTKYLKSPPQRSRKPLRRCLFQRLGFFRQRTQGFGIICTFANSFKMVIAEI